MSKPRRTSQKEQESDAGSESRRGFDVHHHNPEHAHTLARTAVKRPAANRAIGLGNSKPVVRRKASARRLNTVRIARAQSAAKSQRIVHFSASVTTPHTIEQSPLPTAFTMQPKQIKEGDTTRLLRQALEQARSHEQRPLKKTRRLAVGGATVVALVVFLIAIIAYQNADTVRLRLATSRAGLAQGLTAYAPNGYGLHAVDARSGQVTVTYMSHSDQSSAYTIHEAPSNLTLETLRDSIIATQDPSYQAFALSDKTVFIYGNGSASWLAGGALFTIESNGQLGTEQLLAIAKSN